MVNDSHLSPSETWTVAQGIQNLQQRNMWLAFKSLNTSFFKWLVFWWKKTEKTDTFQNYLNCFEKGILKFFQKFLKDWFFPSEPIRGYLQVALLNIWIVCFPRTVCEGCDHILKIHWNGKHCSEGKSPCQHLAFTWQARDLAALALHCLTLQELSGGGIIGQALAATLAKD